jgi:hypothetical protein
MRTQKGKIAIVVLSVLMGGTAFAWADEAASISGSPPASSYPGYNSGWRFTVTEEITITHLGLIDLDEPGFQGTYTVGLWKNPKAGGFQFICSVEISGTAGELVRGHRYMPIPPITLKPDTEPPYESGGVLYGDRYLLGVWSPPDSPDRIKIWDRTAATISTVIRLGEHDPPAPRFPYDYTAYTWNTSTMSEPPWPFANRGGVSSTEHFGVNFRYTRPGPTAEAGPDVSIYTSEQALTLIAGVGGHTYPTTPIQYRWLEGATVLQDRQDVGLFGTASLSLAAPVPALAIGAHTLTLEVTDGGRTASDTMVLTLDNTPPAAVPVTGHVLEIGADAILIQGSVADFDGDTVTYKWLKDGQELETGSLDAQAGGGEVPLPDLVIPAGDPRFPLGVNQIQLEVSDGVNPAESAGATVEMIDTTAPTVTPTVSALMLWPPNHQLIPITIWVNTQDNGGGTLHLTANVTCSEDDGGTDPDWYVDDVADAAGTIALRLRAERSGTGEGRVYNVAITAIDYSNNQSSVATVEIRVPHDKRKK